MEMERRSEFSVKELVLSTALSIGLVTGSPAIGWTDTAFAVPNPAMYDVAVLISGPPIKDPEALLRYALPINNKAIRDVQKPLEDVNESLKVSGTRAIDGVERVTSSGRIVSDL